MEIYKMDCSNMEEHKAIPSEHNISLEKLVKSKPDFNFGEYIKDRIEYNSEGKCINAFEILSDINTIYAAYITLKSKPGNMVEGSDKQTLIPRRRSRGGLDGINKD